MKKLTFLALALAVVMTTGNFVAVAETIPSPLANKIIALDAGHDDVAYGASNIIGGVLVTEAEVNWDVVVALESKLTAQGAKVVIAGRYSTRRDRVNDAVAKCAAVDVAGDGTADNKKCDVLVSVHHNGITDNPTHDGTLTIYTQKSDKPLAQSLLTALTPLTGDSEGMLNGGYGMTVYKNLVSAITEAYYITNDCEAELYLYSKNQLTDIQVSPQCKTGVYILENRIEREADLQVAGLSNYFDSQSSGGGGKPR